MKRLPRNPGKFEALETYTAFSRVHDLKMQSPEDTDKFLEMFGESLKASVEDLTLLHGKRTEILFGHLAAALKGCRIVKSEDSGDVMVDDSEMALPDYRLTLKDGRQIFVEVKNRNHPKPTMQYVLHKNYVSKLQNYADANGVPLYFAIFYRCLRVWTLLPISAFKETQNKYITNAVHSLANSELGILGDLMIGTKPPITFELVADKTKDITVDENGVAHFIIGDAKIYAAGEEIEDKDERNIAFYLVRYGKWDCDEPEGILDENKVLERVRYTFVPHDMEEAKRDGFSIIGHLSSMITEAFNEQTIYEQKVTAMDTRQEPEVFSVKIAPDYQGKTLKLWRFRMQANPDFDMDSNAENHYHLTMDSKPDE